MENIVRIAVKQGRNNTWRGLIDLLLFIVFVVFIQISYTDYGLFTLVAYDLSKIFERKLFQV